eukprot:SAG31_NODE_40414_length_281_cov_0.571429_1_plen_50_part_10
MPTCDVPQDRRSDCRGRPTYGSSYEWSIVGAIYGGVIGELCLRVKIICKR